MNPHATRDRAVLHIRPARAVVVVAVWAFSLIAAGCDGSRPDSASEPDSGRAEQARAGSQADDAAVTRPTADAGGSASGHAGSHDQGSAASGSGGRDETHAQPDGSSPQNTDAAAPAAPEIAEPGTEPPNGPSLYAGVLPVPGTPASIGNTRIFDDIAGLTWNAREQELLFVVGQVNQIRRWRAGLPDEQNFAVVRPGGEHMDDMKGLDLGPDGALWVCEARYALAHRVSRSADGYDHPVTVVDHWQGSAEVPAGDFTSPWYISARWDGNVYFTDTPHRWSGAPDKRLFRIDPTGQLTLLKQYASDADLSEGGAVGIALSPNQRAFYISTWNHPGYPQLVRFDLDSDGSVADETLLMTDEDGPIQSVDGLCIDQAENLYLCTGGGGVRMYSSAGELLGSIDVPGATDCSFGGADGKTLFVATSGGVAGDKNLYQVPLNIPGLP